MYFSFHIHIDVNVELFWYNCILQIQPTFSSYWFSFV